MGTFLIIFAYLCYAIFLLRIIWRIVLLLMVRENSPSVLQSNRFSERTTVRTFMKAARDIVFLTRLFRTNPLLWIGEWIFHAAFILVLIRHLRYVLDHSPDWLMNIMFLGMLAGYVLPASLIFILVVKLCIEKKKYFSTQNFLLLSLLLLLSITGIIMNEFIHPDIMEIKIFVLNALSLKIIPAPASVLFIIHFITASVFLALLPAHIFAAPFTMLEARKHDDLLDQVMHEK